MINNEFIYDVENGIRLNLTFLTKPKLTQILKSEIFGDVLLQLAKLIFKKEHESINKLQDTLISILTFGMLGGAFSVDNPEDMPEITPAVNMDFNTAYFTNDSSFNFYLYFKYFIIYGTIFRNVTFRIYKFFSYYIPLKF